jgi:PPOX class probable F420-dependent enzyme
MTPDEQIEFLDSQPFGVLGTLGPHGYPHQVNVGFALDGPTTVISTSFATAQKVLNVRRSPQASFLVENTAPYSEIRGVLWSGRAAIVDDRDQVASWYYRLKERSSHLMPAANLPPIDHERIIPKRVLIVLSAERTISWDHRKLEGVY